MFGDGSCSRKFSLAVRCHSSDLLLLPFVASEEQIDQRAQNTTPSGTSYGIHLHEVRNFCNFVMVDHLYPAIDGLKLIRLKKCLDGNNASILLVILILCPILSRTLPLYEVFSLLFVLNLARRRTVLRRGARQLCFCDNPAPTVKPVERSLR